jgi:8-amino-7-oxononanoate synthase
VSHSRRERNAPASPDLFARCREFFGRAEYARELGHPANPRMLEALGLYPYFIPVEETGGTEVSIDGKRLVMMGSNDYLGMTTEPAVQQAAARAIERYGTGCTGSRFLNGTLELHLELEARLADFVGKESALVFSAGYQTNLGVLPALLGDGDLVVADRDAHASLIDGIRLARGMTNAEARFFKHNDCRSLARHLARAPEEQSKLVVVDGLYSAMGDLAPLQEVSELCRDYGARLLVDEAHALGVLGKGRGTAVHFGCEEAVDLVVGTFSKSFASSGGFVAGPKEVMHWLQHYSRSFMFSAALPPANAATVLAVLDLIESEPQRVERVNQLAGVMRVELRSLGYDVRDSHGAIVPIVTGDQFRTVQLWRRLFSSGVYTNAVLPPAVPARNSALRTSLMATHTADQVARAVDGFRECRDAFAKKRIGVNRGTAKASALTQDPI